jgi:TolB-like protein
MVLTGGCASTAKDYYIRSSTDFSKLTKIAIIPFENVSGQPDADKRVTNIFLTSLYSSGLFDVVDMGEVEKSLIEERVRSLSDMNYQIIRNVANRLHVQALVLGTVEEYQMVRTGTDEVPVVSISARIVDAASGEILWVMSHSRAGSDREKLFGMGRIESFSKLTGVVVDEMVRTIESGMPTKPARRIRSGVHQVRAGPGYEERVSEAVQPAKPAGPGTTEGIPAVEKAAVVEAVPSVPVESTGVTGTATAAGEEKAAAVASGERAPEQYKDMIRDMSKKEFDRIKKQYEVPGE